MKTRTLALPSLPCRKETKIENSSSLVTSDFRFFSTPGKISKALASFKATSVLALDTETTGSTESQTLRLLQLCDGQNLPVLLWFPQITEKNTSLLQPFFANGKEFIIQNSAFDLSVLRKACGVELSPGRIFDTYIASALLTNTAYSKEVKKGSWRRNYHPNSLDSIVQRILGIVLDKVLQGADWSVNLSLPEHESMRLYAANDVRYLHQIRLALRSQLEIERLMPVYELERDLVPCVAQMNERGIPADLEVLAELHNRAVKLTAQEEACVLKILGRSINLRSRKHQLLPVLQEMKITYKGEPLTTTSKKVLPLVDQPDHPVIQAILDWSSANEEAKQLQQWLDCTNPSTGISYPQANQFGTVTHRFAYRSPNLQQVKKSDIRTIIPAPPGEVILRGDFKTLELVVGAVYHKEITVLEALARGIDLHTLTASVLFKVSPGKVTPKQRALGKLTNLSLEYGRGLDGYLRECRLAKVDLPDDELEKAYYKYDELWPNLAAYREHTAILIARGRAVREIRSMYGRRILLDTSLSSREMRGAHLNYPIQTSASDLLKLTMRNLWHECKNAGISILASVHDELLLSVKPENLDRAKGLLRESARDAGKVIMGPDVPVRLEVGHGKSWWDASQEEELL